MNYLYEDGKQLCEVTDLVTIPGTTRVQTVSFIGGGSAQLPGRRTPDRVRFSCTVSPNIPCSANHELRDETGQVAPILIERLSGNLSSSTVTAILL